MCRNLTMIGMLKIGGEVYSSGSCVQRIFYSSPK